jgi:hypothetical protein
VATIKPYFWKRVGYVEIEGEDGKMYKYGGSVDGLDFKFDIKYSGDIAVEFTVGILGLSRETIQTLTVWNYAQAISRARKIAVYAGYEKDGIAQPIASGIITQAIPTTPPDMWLNFNCLIGGLDFDPKYQRCIKDKTAAEILDMLARANKMKSRWLATKAPGDRKIPKFYVGRSPLWVISNFAASQNVHICIDADVLTAVDTYAWAQIQDKKVAEVIGVETGLLSIGNVDLKGAIIKRRLDVRSRLMTWVRLKSVIIPSASDDYYVIGKRHVGQYRGEEWTTELQTIRRVRT